MVIIGFVTPFCPSDWAGGNILMISSRGLVSKPLSLGLVHRVAMQCIANDTIMNLLANQPKTRIVGWSVHNEREGNCLPSLRAVVSPYPDIVMGISFAALIDLIQNGG